MGILARIGFFSTDNHTLLGHGQRTKFKTLLCELLKIENLDGVLLGEKDIAERIVSLGHAKEQHTAIKVAKTIT